jgi:hypothetical protein
LSTPKLPFNGVAAVMSLFIPGLGQLYKGHIGIGFVWGLCAFLGYIFLVVPGIIIHLACIYDAGNGE